MKFNDKSSNFIGVFAMKSIPPFLAAFILLLLLPGAVWSQKAYPFRKEAKWFLVDSNFKKIGRKNYSFITPLWDTRFLVKNKKGLCGIATEKSKLLIPIEYERIDFYDGMYHCAVNKQYDYFDASGKPIKPTIFGFGCPGPRTVFSNVNTYTAKGKVGLFYYNYQKNKYDTLPAIYEYVQEYVTNIAVARLNGKWGIITEKGETLAPFQFDSIQVYGDCSFYRSCVNIYTQGNYKGYINEKGQIITPAKYLDAQFFSNQYALVMDNSKRWGYIDRAGREYFK